MVPLELRTLRYFVTLVDVGTVTGAAKMLHMTQPTLSRQLSQMERQMGRRLFERRHAGVELTEAGVALNRYARRILELADKASEEIGASDAAVSGSVHIGAGETGAARLLARAISAVRTRYPGVTFDIRYGASDALMDNLVHGHLDVLLECGLRPHSDFNVLELPAEDVWGIYVRPDSPLAELETVTIDDLAGVPVILSTQGSSRALGAWAGKRFASLNVAATYNLPLSGRLLAEEGIGAFVGYGEPATSLDESDGSLAFRELSPRLEAHHDMLWRKTLPTRQAQAFIDELQRLAKAQPADIRGVESSQTRRDGSPALRPGATP